MILTFVHTCGKQQSAYVIFCALHTLALINTGSSRSYSSVVQRCKKLQTRRMEL